MTRLSGNFERSLAAIIEITLETLHSDPELKLCEGLRLIDATRTAVSRQLPHRLEDFERSILPGMRAVLLERFGLSCDRPVH